VFDPAAGARCLLEMKNAQGCGKDVTVPACNYVYRGTIGAGESCTATPDCALPSNGYASICDDLRGICVALIRGALYDECQQSCEVRTDGRVPCVWGPVSNPYSDGSIVVSCLRNDGLACGDNGWCIALATTGEYCVNDSSCSRELYCATALGNVCQPRGKVGASCVDDYTMPCVVSAYCNAGICAQKKSNGADCKLDTECQGYCNWNVNSDGSTAGICADLNALAHNFNEAVSASQYCAISSTS
jgi:hypothetical protein